MRCKDRRGVQCHACLPPSSPPATQPLPRRARTCSYDDVEVNDISLEDYVVGAAGGERGGGGCAKRAGVGARSPRRVALPPASAGGEAQVRRVRAPHSRPVPEEALPQGAMPHRGEVGHDACTTHESGPATTRASSSSSSSNSSVACCPSKQQLHARMHASTQTRPSLPPSAGWSPPS